MTGHELSTRIRRVVLAATASAAAFGMIGAATYEWAEIRKADRLEIAADCQPAAEAAGPLCPALSEPQSRTGVIDVAPGLSLVEQING